MRNPKAAKRALSPREHEPAEAATAVDPIHAALKEARTPDPLLTLGETARRLGVSERYVREATRTNRLPYLWINGVKLVLEADLKAFRKRSGLPERESGESSEERRRPSGEGDAGAASGRNLTPP